MSAQDLIAHLQTGHTTTCRCWRVRRKDGMELGFTDHDGPLAFEGTEFRANAGMTAKAMMQTTGLSVDNTEALGALSHESLREADIAAGRFDGAEVTSWIVNWQDVAQRVVQFRGTLGEISRANGAFTAELRGATEALNQPQGRVFQKPCTAVLGDGACKVDTSLPAYRTEVLLTSVSQDRILRCASLEGYGAGWFQRGVAEVITGAAAGLTAVIKHDRSDDGSRVLELWQGLRVPPMAGDMVRLTVGCDKRQATCREKFDNVLNYRGFPHIPGEDWLMSTPTRGGENSGGSMNGSGS